MHLEFHMYKRIKQKCLRDWSIHENTIRHLQKLNTNHHFGGLTVGALLRECPSDLMVSLHFQDWNHPEIRRVTASEALKMIPFQDSLMRVSSIQRDSAYDKLGSNRPMCLIEIPNKNYLWR